MTASAAFIASAAAAFESGFASKAAQKAAQQALSRAYENLTSDIKALFLQGPRTPEGHEVYWAIPHNLHQWRAKHAQAVLAVWPQAANLCDEIAACFALREAIAGAEIAPAQKNEEAEKVERVRESVVSLIQRRKDQFAQGVQLVEIFGKLPVTVNYHWVTNANGTTFVRHFFYMSGKLTPLNIILAVMEATAEA